VASCVASRELGVASLELGDSNLYSEYSHESLQI